MASGTLLRVLGPVFCLAAVVGGVVGQGILRSPGVVAQASASPTVLLSLWGLGGLFALLGALCYAELGAAMPGAGGGYDFVVRAFGPRAGAFVGFCTLISLIAAVATYSYIIGELLVRLGIGGGLKPSIVGLAALAVFCAVNALGTRMSGASQVALAGLKGALLLALVAALLGHPGVAAAPAPVAPRGIAFATAFMVITNTYNGWQNLVYYGEEVLDPGRHIPGALIRGILGVVCVYLLVNVALIHVLPHAVLAASTYPAGDAAAAVFGSRGDLVLTIFGLVSLSAIANLFIMHTTRLAFAMARTGRLPNVLARVSRRGTPLIAMLSISAIAAAFTASGTYLSLVATTTVLAQFVLVTVLVSMIALRRSEPGLARPYRTPFHPWIAYLATATGLALLVAFLVRDPVNAAFGFLLALGLFALSLVAARRRSLPASAGGT